ncbi:MULTISPECIES: PepSY-associated TM helix domain-containing protein [unclassified Caballeronia]|uniref:PepSY-associated TM helix domain-containing protein n=1 Tax=unclassified Caballeronia TaxID=2646786 RepID=UPI0028553346|nr:MULTISPECIES: PepSY-associated TM helix domain-containing protein [unclassified Caballeronia]MDR5752835.1 PepSY-associated TM helix domain-containing protein [Caballeronia sp. LZ024]MDR5841479.1 PepSY-associated TM helix domain-containing protein [Caballeronia sp. LZ031]
MRPWFVRLHRWLGVATALFLFVSGLTGAIIAWDHELDAALNPSFFYARTDGPALSSLELARRVEAADPRIEVTYLPLGVEPGHTQQMMVLPRTDPATGQAYKVDFNQLAVDPATGEVQGRREWGAVSLARIDLLPFIYKLHYTLHLPFVGGLDVGTWLLGIVGILWFFDSGIALILSFPSVKAWRKSFAFRFGRGGYALTFDLHRSGGVWIWGLLLMMALTSVSMNLADPIMRPIVSVFSPLAPTILNNPELARPSSPGATPLTREAVLARAIEDGRERGLAAPPGALYYASALHAYAVGFFAPGHDHGDVGLGNPWLHYNASTGKLVGSSIPGKGSAGDIFMQAQFPLHSGRIAGIPGRILVSAVGIAVAMLSATGLMIWIRKRSARRQSAVAKETRAVRGNSVSS